VITAKNSLSTSGTLVFEGAASGSSLYLGTSLQGAGLTDCDTATQTLAWDATTGRFSCGTDSDTTYTAGQGLTLNGSSFKLNATITGSLIQASTTLASSGSILAEGTISGSNLYAGNTISGSNLYVTNTLRGAGLTDCSTAGTSKLLWNSTTGRFSCGTDQTGGGGITAGQGLTLNGTVITLNATITGSLIRFQTVSGSVITAKNSLSTSGTLVFEGAASGSSLYLGTSFNGAGLTDCLAGNKLLWNASTGRFSCGVDQASGTGLDQNSGDARYVQRQGDTMTGALTIAIQNGTLASVGLKVINTLSGAIIHAEKNLSASGTLLIRGVARFQDSVNVVGTLSGASLTVMGGNSYLLGNVGIGKTGTPNTKFEVVGSISGSTIYAANTIRSSGSILAEGTISGANLYAGNTISGSNLYVTNTLRGAGLVDCSTAGTSKLLWNSATGRFSCGSDQNTGTAYTAGQGLTLTSSSFKLNATLTGSTLKFTTVSGSLVQADTTLASSGTLVVRGVARFKNNVNVIGTLSGASLTVMGGNSYLLGNVGIGKTGTPNTKFEVVGTISGSTIYAANTIRSSGSIMAEGTISGSNLYAGNTISGSNLYVTNTLRGAGLVDCSTAGTSKLLWNSTTGRFSCGTDQNTGGTSSFSTGNVLTIGGQKYVSKQGDTMTGSLIISIQNGTLGSIGLKVLNTLSGAIIHAEKALTSSGILMVRQTTTSQGSGALTVVNNTRYGTGAYMVASGAILVLDSTAATRGGLNSPHILFGYQGNFDTNLYRSTGSMLRTTSSFSIMGTGTLLVGTGSIRRNASGALVIGTQNSFNRDAITINTDETTGTQTMFRIISDVASTNDNAFRITANGATFSDNAYSSGGADYAEWFYSGNASLVSGEVVCIDITKNNTVKRCANDADSNVMGVVSTNPAYIGNSITGADGLIPPGYALIGLIGQVPTKVIVTGSGDVIRPGDALTAASIPGFGRKARPGESTLGVSLEGLDHGRGSVNVLISRRNSSITVDAVGQKVLDTIASMKIGDEVQIMVAASLKNLNVDDKITAAVQAQVDGIRTADANIVTLQVQVDELKARIDGMHTSTGSSVTLVQSGSFLSNDLLASTLSLEKTLSVGGDARVAGDLYIDGALMASSLFVPNGITIDGGTTVNGDLTTQTVHATSGATINGTLTMNGNIRLQNGSILFDSGALMLSDLIVSHSLKILGDITIHGMATFLGDISVHGELSVSSRQAGFAHIPKSGTAVTVSFGSTFKGKPVVTASAEDFVYSPWRIHHVSGTGFSIELAAPATDSVTFSWLALTTDMPVTTSAMLVPNLSMIFPMGSDNIPVSSDHIWNGCIRNTVVLDDTGSPYSCSRYHDEFTWHQQDLNIDFLWNTNMNPPLLQIPDGYTAQVTESAENIRNSFASNNEESSVTSSDLQTDVSSVVSSADTTEGASSSASSELTSVDSSASSESSEISSAASSVYSEVSQSSASSNIETLSDDSTLDYLFPNSGESNEQESASSEAALPLSSTPAE
jgi:cytoskeletal protein CcmA (bactofilin family)